MNPVVKVDKSIFQTGFILLPRHAIHSRRSLTLKRVEAVTEQINVQMVEQGSEPFLPSFPCCFSHTVQPLGHALPALRQVHAWLRGVLLHLRPSLPNLRRSVRSFVRLVHRFYGAVCLLHHVHVRIMVYGLRGPAFLNWQRRDGDLPVLVHVVSLACAGSNDYAGPDNHSRITRLPYCLPPTRHGVGILNCDFSKLNHPAHQCLYLRFECHLAMTPARLKARMDSLLPFL